MTKAELNRDCKRLLKLTEPKRIKIEISRIYYADKEFEYLNRSNILILIRMNLIYRVVPLHLFGTSIEIDHKIVME